eukprot:gene57648-biopygen62653
MLREQSMVKAAVELAGSVTAHLSRYETVAARDLIDGEHGDALPPQLRETLGILVDNLCDYKPYTNRPPEVVSKWLAVDTSRTIDCVQREGGVIDLLSSDRRFVSFGAARKCFGAHLAALHCAWRLANSDDPFHPATPPCEIAASVCHGPALCGDFGSDTSIRFMSIGGVSTFCVVVERLATHWQIRVLIDEGVH